MSELHKKSTTKANGKSRQLTEERIREIAREEIIKYMGEEAMRHLSMIDKDIKEG